MVCIRDAFPIVFENKGRNKPHSQRYRGFTEKWSDWKTFYEVCDEKIEKVRENYQLYLTDYLQFLSYLIDKAEADEEEMKYQENLRKAKGR